MNHELALLIAAVPAVGGAALFIFKAVSWRRQLAARESDSARLREELEAAKRDREIAKQELEKFTRFLEKRIDARTAELKAAQDEIIRLQCRTQDP